MNVDLLGDDTPRATPAVLTVSQLNARVKELLENEFGEVLVEGEISSWRTYPSGHSYFDLKDVASRVSAVMFSGRRRFLRFEPEVGMRVMIRCRVTLYEKDGRFQVSALSMEPLGEGALEVAFRQLHERLEKEGLFDSGRKKEIPERPRRVALVTSREGAALQDMLRVFRERAPVVELVVVHTLVQGESAASSIAAAIRRVDEGLANIERPVDLIITGRGGGSREDLWAFNEEEVVRAIAGCATPLISAVGHEVDTSLSDLAADESAHTPTAAAERVARGWLGVARDITNLVHDARRAVATHIASLDERLSRLLREAAFRRPEAPLESLAQRLDALYERMSREAGHQQEMRRARLTGMVPRLRVLSPKEKIVVSISRLEDNLKRLRAAHGLFLKNRADVLKSAAGRLELVSPLAVLARGYSLVYKEPDGALVKKAEDVRVDESVRIRLPEGGLMCRVEKVFPEGEGP